MRSSLVFGLGLTLVVIAAGRGMGWQNLWLNLSTAPTGFSDADRRAKLFYPYGGALLGVIVATVASSINEEIIGSFFLGTEGLIFLLIAVGNPVVKHG